MWTPNVITLWEALLTVLQYGLLLTHAYAQDKRWPYLSLPMYAWSLSFFLFLFPFFFLWWWKQDRFFWKYASKFHSDLPGKELRGQRNGCHLRLLYASRNFKPMKMIREALLTFSLSMIKIRKVIVKLIHFSVCCLGNRLNWNAS